MISLIVAFDEERGIGKNNQIPWFIKGELAWVAKTTKTTTTPNRKNALIMGRKTWESLPKNRRPLPDRINIVISRNSDFEDSDKVRNFHSIEEAVYFVTQSSHIEKGFIFGGSSIYQAALKNGLVDEVLETLVPGTHGADTFFPELPKDFCASEQHEQEYDGITVKRQVHTRQGDA